MTAEPHGRPELARIVDLGRRRADRAAAADGLVPVEPDDDDQDHESVLATPDGQGGPVDPPDEPATLYATVTAQRDHPRRPLVPGWLRNRDQRRQVARWAVGFTGHAVAEHLIWSPVYAVKVGVYAPWGAARLVGRLVGWATAEQHNWSLRQAAASRDDAATWLALDRVRERQSRWRWWVVAAVLLAVVAAVLALAAAPVWGRWVALAVVAPVLARFGRPVGKPIVHRVHQRARYRKLTADLVRRGVMATGLVKNPEDIRFEREIVRDGPGYLAVVDLPDGVIAVNVVDRRAELAGGLRLPHDQVWPEVMPREHPSRLALWVADRPVSAMRQPAWPHLDGGPLDYFAPFAYGFDPRGRVVRYQMDERNSLFAGVPGSGKSLSGRVVAAAMALDPLVTFAVFDLAGRGDFDAFEPLCPPGLFGSGADETTKQAAARMVEWLLRECDTRGPIIKAHATAGLNTENKLNRAIAQRDPRCRPIVAVIDEVQELITDPELGKATAARLTSVVKRGRALGIHLILLTQRIDRESLPTGVTSNVALRTCLAVPSHKEVELALGTGQYRAGARPTAFEVGVDAGWGVRVGYGPMVSVRAAYLDRAAVQRICRRGVALRGGRVEGVDLPDARDLLDDLRTIWVPSETGAHWDVLAGRLAGRWPDAYAAVTAEALSAMVRALGVPSVDVKARGERTPRKGCRLTAIETAIRAREIGS